MDQDLQKKIKNALLESWSENTGFNFSQNTPASYGQFAQTAIVIQEEFGGEIHKTDDLDIIGGLHFYNFISGKVCDFTEDQFQFPGLEQKSNLHKGIKSSKEEAMNHTKSFHVATLRDTFKTAFTKLNPNNGT